tara:strand:+ start:62 stop:286 length:225 start_codon:yes stop_codon:yes gene_type:complete
VWDSTENKKQTIKNPTGCGGVGLCGIVCGRGLVQFVADIGIIVDFHTFRKCVVVYYARQYKSSDKNYQSKSDIV